MTIKTLGDFLDAVDRKRKNRVAPTSLSARANVYDAMGRYIGAAGNHPVTESTDTHSLLLGHLIHALGEDARATLQDTKFHYLLKYPLTEDMPRHTPTDERMAEAVRATWGREDRLIEHLSGGLFGSYMKAFTTLKPHARALGRDLSDCAHDYLRSL